MPTKELPDNAPGKYVPYHPNPYYSPEPLPVEPKLELSDQTHDLVADAAYQIGRVDGISSTVDFSAVLYTSLIRIEAVESARIEGADVAYQDVEAYHTKHPAGGAGTTIEKDLKEALNYETALTYGLDRIESGTSITLSLIKELHSMLLEDVRNEGDVVGDFRDHMVHPTSPQPGQRPFVPPTPEELTGLMHSLESYIQMGGQYHPLVDAGIIHYFFETVHPFSDGNGRLGRLLIILYLASEGYLESPYIFPSAYFNRHKVEYVERMRAVSEDGAWDEWLTFFLEGLRSQAETSYDRTHRLRDLQERYEKEYPGSTNTDTFARHLLQYPYFKAPDLMGYLDVSRRTAYKVVDDLESDGLIEEVTGKERGKEYKAVEVFDILE
ncbi:Fido domain protein (plasmid) [Natrialba magadii ATCC 43099]|uniref:Fido domain protein n=1 Tax=Natrialba magadii (strain ATCC 43099 / DSM 3394 / CCM 3739 / CIP 104546 / IAM 13178 / JCM 8861 / NBRC 102185 / NCIMB 2190 / MS3) TaxID=547559 RepID=D3T289_NATMM|nr:Fic family protein [Natrialba magadii]ADD07698.1 Fido domain protein [Natrialba magadii ATCC 43099]ELY26508.1 filamentation induced by cAMP protein fic [Natrialba magadii ATCC 43099]